MGGAGFMFPMRISASRGYKEEDLVTVLLDFSAGTITFSVNRVQVGTTPWPSSSTVLINRCTVVIVNFFSVLY